MPDLIVTSCAAFANIDVPRPNVGVAESKPVRIMVDPFPGAEILWPLFRNW
jgi:hypothetical protein